MKKIYSVNGLKFESKKSLKDHCKMILYSGELNSSLSGEELDFMLDYFEQFHSQWELKKGCGVKAISRIQEPFYGKPNVRAFWLTRLDGSDTDISYDIYKIQQRNYYYEFSQAMRQNVRPQIDVFRNNAFDGKDFLICPITGETFRKHESHIDHYAPTFKELVDEFISYHSLELKPSLFPKEQDRQMEYDITDEAIKVEFYVYHLQNANLRAVSKKGNLTRGT